MSVPNTALKVLVVGDFDSFLRAGQSLATTLETKGAQIDYALVFRWFKQISETQLRGFGLPTDLVPEKLSSVLTKKRLTAYDVVIVSLNGTPTRKFMAKFHELWKEGDAKRPVAVSLYPGLIFRFHLEGMMSRSSCDLVMLNSRYDLKLYQDAARSLGLPGDNAVWSGLSFLPQKPRKKNRTGGAFLFAGQPTAPVGRYEREYVVESLAKIAASNPQSEVILKPRHRPSETTLHRIRYHYEELLLQKDVPANLIVSYEPIAKLFERTKVCMTFSSTAALEALALGIPTRVITDLGIHENLGNHFFVGSGLLGDFSTVTAELPFQFESDWYERYAAPPEQGTEEAISKIFRLLEEQASTGKALPPPQSRLFGRAKAFNSYVSRRDPKSLWRFGDSTQGMIKRVVALEVSRLGNRAQGRIRRALRRSSDAET